MFNSPMKFQFTLTVYAQLKMWIRQKIISKKIAFSSKENVK